MGAWVGDPDVVLLAAPALQAILATSPFLTAATFAKFDVLAVLAAAALKQAEAAMTQASRITLRSTFCNVESMLRSFAAVGPVLGTAALKNAEAAPLQASPLHSELSSELQKSNETVRNVPSCGCSRRQRSCSLRPRPPQGQFVSACKIEGTSCCMLQTIAQLLSMRDGIMQSAARGVLVSSAPLCLRPCLHGLLVRCIELSPCCNPTAGCGAAPPAQIYSSSVCTPYCLLPKDAADVTSPQWRARAAVLHLIAAYLGQAPAAARSGLCHAPLVLVLVGLLKAALPRPLALHAVRPRLCFVLQTKIRQGEQMMLLLLLLLLVPPLLVLVRQLNEALPQPVALHAVRFDTQFHVDAAVSPGAPRNAF